MREKMVITLYDSFTNIDDRFLQEAALQSSSMHKGFLKKTGAFDCSNHWSNPALRLCGISSRCIRSVDSKNIDISNGNGAKRA